MAKNPQPDNGKTKPPRQVDLLVVRGLQVLAKIQDPMRITHFGRALLETQGPWRMHAAKVNRVVGMMEGRGLVRKDSRATGTFVVITEAGRQQALNEAALP